MPGPALNLARLLAPIGPRREAGFLIPAAPEREPSLDAHFAHYHRARTHLYLGKDAPDGRPIEPPAIGPIIPIPEVGGLHHRYVRRAAQSRHHGGQS